MKLAVLGCHSFGGSWLVKTALDSGHSVIGINRSSLKDKIFCPYSTPLDPLRLNIVEADINKHLDVILDFLERNDAFLKTNVPALAMQGWDRFVTNLGYPVTNPPWGSVNAINLSGDSDRFQNVWKVPIGNSILGKKKGIVTGTEVFGGVTFVDSGVLLISGTRDNKLHILDSESGEIIWEYEMPTTGAAAPTVFRSNGVVYFFVQATGLGKLEGSSTENKSYYHLFALPNKKTLKSTALTLPVVKKFLEELL